MFGLLFKFILMPLLLLALAIAGALAYAVLTPIDEGNVKSRIWQACMLASGLQTANNWSRSNPRPVYSSDQCTCVGDTLVATMGPAAAATGAEAVRTFIEAGLRSWLSGGNFRDLQRAPAGQIAEVFVSASSRLARSCAAPQPKPGG